MSTAFGKSALASFNITQWPIGTTEEVRGEGYDTKTVASCCGGPEAQAKGLRPCPVFDSCQFNLRSMGGFKETKGPRNIGYRYIDPADGTATEDMMSCHTWTMTQQGKADANAALRRRTGGKHGAVIRIIAQEPEIAAEMGVPDHIMNRCQLPVNLKGEVIKQGEVMQKLLKDNDVPFSTIASEVTTEYRFFELKRTVPRYPRPGEMNADSYAHRVAMRDMDNETHDRAFVDYGMREAEMPPLPDAQPVDVVSEPVRRGPGRPRKIETE
jgi:hypothetical protein